MTKQNMEFEIPNSIREFAEKSVDQAQAAYTQFKDAAEEAVSQLDKSTNALKDSTVDYNQKAIEFTQTNVNASFDLARKLAGAKDVNEFFTLQTEFARKQAETFSGQAKDLANLGRKVAEDASEPVKANVEKTMAQAKSNMG